MGVFSWCTSDTKKSIPCCTPFGGLPGTVYLLNPFGDPYKESNYEGYGEFDGRDVYDLVVEWNRAYLSPENVPKPERSSYSPGEEGDAYYAKAVEKYMATCEAIQAYAAGATDSFMQEKYGKTLGYGDGSDWKRCLGITIACYDEDHVKLRYPIKIVEHPTDYEKAGISPACPFQGCIYPERMRDIREGVKQAFVDLASEEAKWKALQQERNEPKGYPDGLNTRISYLYRDADNYKTHNECVVEGVMTPEQQKIMLECLHDGEYFIPHQVGLPERRFDDGVTEADHCWFELDEFSFADTTEPPTIGICAGDLVKAFCAKKDSWDDTYLLESEKNEKASFDFQIKYASLRAVDIQTNHRANNKEHIEI